MDELVGWTDTTLSELNRYFSFWRSQRSPEVLEEAVITTTALYHLLEEIKMRRPGVEPSPRTRQLDPPLRTKPRVT